jgi:hypothetical protein
MRAIKNYDNKKDREEWQLNIYESIFIFELKY